MKYIADLHIHSRYSRACSKDINIENLEKYARLKGVGLLGTGDFTHPEWIKEIDSKLTEDESGILRTSTGFPFLWQTEISLMYKQGGRGRRVHHVILAPGGEAARQFTDALSKKGRLDYDGRPIFGFSSIELMDMLLFISDKFMVIPAHAWTPYFGILGSKSGFDSIEECFQEKSKHVYAIETGMSSDPAMNWRLSSLDKYSLVSFSDLHSFWPWRMGREATVFDIELSYDNIFKAIKTREGLVGTIEVKPDYGRYHLDGHAKCGVVFEPEETIKHRGVCPVCGKALTVGVLYRVNELADRPDGFRPVNARDFTTLLPLSEIIKGVMGASGLATKKVWAEYYNVMKGFSSEFEVIMDAPREELVKFTSEKVADGIIRARNNGIYVKPGYDGEYGVPVFDEGEAASFENKSKVGVVAEKNEDVSSNKQKGLTDFC
ncbi:MAG: endonuclease Q family protein [archaeon]